MMEEDEVGEERRGDTKLFGTLSASLCFMDGGGSRGYKARKSML